MISVVKIRESIDVLAVATGIKVWQSSQVDVSHGFGSSQLEKMFEPTKRPLAEGSTASHWLINNDFISWHECVKYEVRIDEQVEKECPCSYASPVIQHEHLYRINMV